MKASRFDAADYLDSPEAIAAYLSVVLEEDDPKALIRALGTVARSEGMTEVSRRTGLNRESLYKALGEHGNPSYVTVWKIMRALGVRMTSVPDSRELIEA